MSEPGRLRDLRFGGWFRVENVVCDYFAGIVGPSGLAVYMALCRIGNMPGDCVVSIERIGQLSGLKRTAVKTALRKLEASRLIKIYQRVDDEGQREHEYVLFDAGWAAGRRASEGPAPIEEDDASLGDVIASGYPGGVPGRKTTGGRNTTGDPQSENDCPTSKLKKRTDVKDGTENRSSSLSMTETIGILDDVRSRILSGWTVRELLEAGLLDAETWAEAKRSSLARSSQFRDVDFTK